MCKRLIEWEDWLLGNFIGLSEYREQGIGSALTSHLMKFFQYQGCISQVLIATSLGEPVYEKLASLSVPPILS